MVEVREVDGELRCTIRSENDAWDLLKRANENEFDDREVIPEFDGWPFLDLKFWVNGENQTVTAPIMEGLLSFQSSISRAFLLVEEGTTNLRNLSDEDRKTQEIKFEIKQGSTVAEPNLTDIAKEFVKAAGANMTGTQVTIVIMAALLLWASVSAWKAWLDNKAKSAQDDTHSQDIKQILEAGRVADATDVERTALLVGAIEKAMGDRALVDTADEGKRGIVRAASKVDASEIAGVDLPPKTAKRIVRSARTTPTLETMDGSFRVVRIDSDYAEGFRAKIRNEETGEEFFAGLRDALISQEDKAIIATAEWDKVPFLASIAVQRQRGEVASAEITSVTAAESGETAAKADDTA